MIHKPKKHWSKIKSRKIQEIKQKTVNKSSTKFTKNFYCQSKTPAKTMDHKFRINNTRYNDKRKTLFDYWKKIKSSSTEHLEVK